ncbi:MAG: arginine repressor [Proteobacteria bacterium]|nr:MAG: arginine repressor [Pseudomonadota bacterium]
MSNSTSESRNDAKDRLSALRGLLLEGKLSTQEELREELVRLDFDVTQSTVSRDLRRIGAMKVSDAEGRIIYRLAEESASPPVPAQMANNLRDLVLSIDENGFMVVVNTTPGSASLVARHIDSRREGTILGTIAGDDTIFVAPAKGVKTSILIQDIEDAFFI